MYESARTTVRVGEDQIVDDAGEEDRGDVRERRDGGVVAPARLAAEERQGGEAAAEVTRGVGSDTDGREAPDGDATACVEPGPVSGCVRTMAYMPSRDGAYYASAISQGMVVGVARWFVGSRTPKTQRPRMKSQTNSLRTT